MTKQFPSIRTMRRTLFALPQSLARAADQMPLRCAFLAVLVLEAFVILAFRPGFETNDDAAMMMIAAGKGISACAG